MKNLKRNLLFTSVLFLIFVVFTVLIKTIDVQKAGPLGSEIGFASINLAVFEKFGLSNNFYKLTKLLGFLSFAIIGFFAVLGVYQLIKRKSIKKVDYKIIALGCFYVLVFAFYFLFEIIVINYRPVLANGELEASYPSSHTILSLCVISSALIVLKDMLKDKKWLKITAYCVGIAIMAVMAVGRLLSGIHWFTDIIGAILLSCALVMLFYSSISYLKEKYAD